MSIFREDERFFQYLLIEFINNHNEMDIGNNNIY